MSDRPLRICLTSYRGNMRCGGQGIYLWFLARELAKLGHQIDVLCGPPLPDDMPFARSVQDLPDPQFWGKWFSRDRSVFFDPDAPLRIFEPLQFYELAASFLGFLPEPFAFSLRAWANLAQRVRSGERWDVIHDVQSLGYGLLGARRLGMPILTTIHHPLSVDRRHSFQRDRTFLDAVGTMAFHPVGMQAFVASRLDRVITSSQVSARQIEADFGVAPDRIRMLGNGLDTELFRRDPSVERSEREVLCVARAGDPTKGVDVLIDALAQLPAHVTLTLVDEEHAWNQARQRARERGCSERLTITGRLEVEELVKLYSRAALVAVPSHYEGFGLPAAEAMACETPVVATQAGALPEVIEAGGGGLLVPSGDAEALAKAIRTLLEQPEARSELGRRARARIEENYSWPRIAAATAQVYRELLPTR